jgi:hypothetical protein
VLWCCRESTRRFKACSRAEIGHREIDYMDLRLEDGIASVACGQWTGGRGGSAESAPFDEDRWNNGTVTCAGASNDQIHQ